MLVALFNLIAGLPALLNALEKLIHFTMEQIEAAKKRKLSNEMVKATEVAKESKDTSKLEKMFGKKN